MITLIKNCYKGPFACNSLCSRVDYVMINCRDKSKRIKGTLVWLRIDSLFTLRVSRSGINSPYILHSLIANALPNLELCLHITVLVRILTYEIS